MDKKYIITEDDLKLKSYMNKIFNSIFKFNNNETLLIWPYNSKQYKNDCKHYKILYPIASVLNEDIIPFKVILINDNDDYTKYVKNYSNSNFNLFASNISITDNKEYLIIEECKLYFTNILFFELYVKQKTNNFHLKFQQELDDYINEKNGYEKE